MRKIDFFDISRMVSILGLIAVAALFYMKFSLNYEISNPVFIVCITPLLTLFVLSEKKKVNKS